MKTISWSEIAEKGPKYATTIIDKLVLKLKKLNFVHNLSHAVPARTAIDGIVRFTRHEKVLEVGAGTGLWAKLLLDNGVDIIPTDVKVGSFTIFRKLFSIKINNTFMKVRKVESAQAGQTFPDRNVLMIVCPDVTSTMCSTALAAHKGNKLIYIGSFRHMKDKAFLLMLDKEWSEVALYNIPQWPGEDNRVFMFKKVNND